MFTAKYKVLFVFFILYAHTQLCAMVLLLQQLGVLNESEFITAVRENNIEQARYLLEQNKDIIDKLDWNNNTALIIATKQNYQELVELLLKNGADKNIKDEFGYTALMWAIVYDRTEIVKLLLAYKANVNAQTDSGTTALMFAAQYERIEIVRLLLQAGADLTIENNYWSTVYNFTKEDSEVYRLLKEHEKALVAKKKD